MVSVRAEISELFRADSNMTIERYNPRAAEPRWQKAWDEAKIFETKNDDPRPKYYVLEMFPYPSGRIHMGHVRNYAMGDVVARYMRARGHNVLHPMGWDAFGLPAENAAKERQVHPGEWTYANIATMKAQLKSMGLSLDWSREFATCDVDYYMQQQSLFLDFLEKGLVYRRQSKVNWDPVDETVLANEQVIDGRGWRSGALVEQRDLTQWFFRITEFSQDLLDALDGLDQWPEKVRVMQRNWIGRSEGLLIRWALEAEGAPEGERELEVYTTRPDTIFGASFMAIAADHPLARHAAESNPALAAFCDECRRAGTSVAALETAEKKGFDTGMRVRHPFDDNWTLPVYVANFVLMDYGTGAIFGCPSGDQRDLDFANKYGLPVTPVVMPGDADAESFRITEEAYTGDGVMINSRFLDGMAPADAFDEVADRLERIAVGGRPQAERKVNFRLRDWGISRQRYWGCPIPVIHCEDCGVVPVPKADLPVKLPDDVDFRSPRQSAGSSSDMASRRLSEMRRARPPRDGHHGHFRRFLLVFRALHGAMGRAPDGSRGGHGMAAGQPIYRRHRTRHPAPALLALLHARHARLRARGPGRTLQGPLHARHGRSRDLPPRLRQQGRMDHSGGSADRGTGRQAGCAARRDR